MKAEPRENIQDEAQAPVGWGIWCTTRGGVTGEWADWLKHDGRPLAFTSPNEAETYLAALNEQDPPLHGGYTPSGRQMAVITRQVKEMRQDMTQNMTQNMVFPPLPDLLDNLARVAEKIKTLLGQDASASKRPRLR
jgi:hypothetical protein